MQVSELRFEPRLSDSKTWTLGCHKGLPVELGLPVLSPGWWGVASILPAAPHTQPHVNPGLSPGQGTLSSWFAPFLLLPQVLEAASLGTAISVK